MRCQLARAPAPRHVVSPSPMTAMGSKNMASIFIDASLFYNRRNEEDGPVGHGPPRTLVEALPRRLAHAQGKCSEDWFHRCRARPSFQGRLDAALCPREAGIRHGAGGLARPPLRV